MCIGRWVWTYAYTLDPTNKVINTPITSKRFIHLRSSLLLKSWLPYPATHTDTRRICFAFLEEGCQEKLFTSPNFGNSSAAVLYLKLWVAGVACFLELYTCSPGMLRSRQRVCCQHPHSPHAALSQGLPSAGLSWQISELFRLFSTFYKMGGDSHITWS